MIFPDFSFTLDIYLKYHKEIRKNEEYVTYIHTERQEGNSFQRSKSTTAQ